jgi:hypothetical protein
VYTLKQLEKLVFHPTGKRHLLRYYGLQISLICATPSRLASVIFGWAENQFFKLSEYMQKVEGIILKTSSFEDSSHILHVLSKEFGIISLVAKGYSSKIQRSYSPLLKIEAIVIQSQKELWKCKELTIVASYTGLRLSLEKLKLASYLIKIVHQILPQKVPLEEIYTLLDEHLYSLSTGAMPYTKASSFLLKFFYLEGMLPPISTHSDQENELLQKILETRVTELDDLESAAELFTRISLAVSSFETSNTMQRR